VTKCSTSPGATGPSPEKYAETHAFRVVTADSSVKGWTAGKTFDIHPAGNGIHLGTYAVAAKKDYPDGKIAVWAVAPAPAPAPAE
jgi:hypothetical protein